MALARGLNAVRQAKTNNDKGRGDARRFFLRGGETAVMRFWGNFEGEEDPIIAKKHYVKKLEKVGNAYHFCGQNADEHAGCVFCHLRDAQKDKGISLSEVAFFVVKDYRKYHKMEADVRTLKAEYQFNPQRPPTEKDYITTKYPACTNGKRPCEFCKVNQAQLQGFRYWELATGYADMLVSQQATLRGYCLCGSRDDEGNGTIYVSQYLCGNCNAQVDFDPAQGKPVASCHACRHTVGPNEELACTGCEEPRRADLQDFLFRVTRIGDGQQTNYNFEPIHPVRPPTQEEIDEYTKFRPDFAELCAPDASEIQAAALGLTGSPFATPGHGAQEYRSQPPVRAPSGSAAQGFQPAGRVAAAVPGRTGAPKPPAPTRGGFKVPKLSAPTVVDYGTPMNGEYTPGDEDIPF